MVILTSSDPFLGENVNIRVPTPATQGIHIAETITLNPTLLPWSRGGLRGKG